MNMALFFSGASWAIGGLVILHSLFQKRSFKYRVLFCAYALTSLLCAQKAFFAATFLEFIVFWGSLLVLLYCMLGLDSLRTAAKAMVIVGFGDFCLILGLIFLMRSFGPSMHGPTPLPTTNFFAIATFALIAIGAIAKAGVFGFHSWITEAAETTPAATMAFLPASLDKFLGIYLLVKAYTDFFAVTVPVKTVLMAIGAFTILFAVLNALIQHNLKKLLAYHAVSQVGYMVLGIATGSVLGIAGGMLHMLNHTIYKSSLFLNAGNLEYRLGKTELSELGGLSRLMPVTFSATLIASLSISGIPPFNGFVSKWIIYQSLLPAGPSWYGALQLVFLVIALFGSALTLASFIKVLYSVFFAPKPWDLSRERIREVPVVMQIPVIVLTALCIFLGIFARNLIIAPVLEPVLGSKVLANGVWKADVVTVLMLLAFLAGTLLYLASKATFRRTGAFIGGENVTSANTVKGTDFYLTVSEIGALSFFYRRAEGALFDFYRLAISVTKTVAYVVYLCVDRLLNLLTNAIGKSAFAISLLFKKIHAGLLDRYVVWLVLGCALIIGVLVR